MGIDYCRENSTVVAATFFHPALLNPQSSGLYLARISFLESPPRPRSAILFSILVPHKARMVDPIGDACSLVVPLPTLVCVPSPRAC